MVLNFQINSVQRLSISDEEYFSEKYGDFISNSKLSLLNPSQGGSWEKYNSGFSKKSEAFKLGTAIHALVLEPDKYQLSEFVAPSGMVATIFDTVYKLTHREKTPLEFDEALDLSVKLHNYYGGELSETRRNTLIKNGQGYYDYLVKDFSEGLIVLNQEDKQIVEHAIRSIKNDSKVHNLLFPAKDEFFNNHEQYAEDVFLIDIEFKSKIYKFKMKVDNWSIDYDNKIIYLNDLKTTSKRVQEFMGYEVFELVWTEEEGYTTKKVQKQGSFQTYHYYRQMYLYKKVLEAYLLNGIIPSLEGWSFKTNIIAIDKDPYKDKDNVMLYEIGDDWMEFGRVESEYLFEMLSQHNVGVEIVEDPFYDL